MAAPFWPEEVRSVSAYFGFDADADLSFSFIEKSVQTSQS